MADSWTDNYLPVDGGRLTGKITVASDDVRFEALYDSSNSEIVKGILGAAGSFAASGGHVAYVKESGSDLAIVLPRGGDRGRRAGREGPDEASRYHGERRKRVHV